jgi:hypothetical protein
MKSIFRHGDSSYVIVKQTPVQHFAKLIGEDPNMEYVQLYMQSLGCDHVLRNETHFMFCETIPDVDFEVIE